jgi:hypothetical protein
LDERLQPLYFFVRGWADGPIAQPRLVRGVWSPDGSDMLPVRLDNVFSSSRTADDKAAVVGLDKHIPRPRPLDVVYHLRNRAPVGGSQSGVFASRDARLTLISSAVGRRID